MEDEKIKCPYCKSTQITIANKGANTGGAIGGAILAGGVGAILGGMSGNKTKLLCMSCGASYTPEERNNIEKQQENLIKIRTQMANRTPEEKALIRRNGLIFLGLIIFIIILVKNCA